MAYSKLIRNTFFCSSWDLQDFHPGSSLITRAFYGDSKSGNFRTSCTRNMYKRNIRNTI
ncbi:Hypothetical predicted protein [Mytilus galloprovincialis]|uniref:Uncharacterized protein n=1 Tax=Mytilus galloprovincialis TaxID=29158 RepID=A0A8B6D9G9_MYTGA|nr:Hypothetical predicted protein [Mytilus galloprovincialis]